MASAPRRAGAMVAGILESNMGTWLTHTRLDQIKNFTLRFVWPCSQSQFCYIMRGMPCLDVVE